MNEDKVRTLLDALDRWRDHKERFDKAVADRGQLDLTDEAKAVEWIAFINNETGKFDILIEDVFRAHDRLKEELSIS